MYICAFEKFVTCESRASESVTEPLAGFDWPNFYDTCA